MANGRPRYGMNTNGQTLQPGHAPECSHPRCTASPQTQFRFPLPLCTNHLIETMARSTELSRQLKAKHAQTKRSPAKTSNKRDHRKVGQHDPVVYYVRFQGLVKIGTTTNLGVRLESIPHDEVLAVEPGSYETEKMRHEQFAEHREKGEWFRQDPALMHWIGVLAATPA